ncbi:hypothetical protein PILCRDRAFT_10362 [Piloderma croceum F 1598]|uniref:Ribosome-assembly protein 3 C-terminal domain-containing protein n=1 Tax=Piloderma croceum (strain F 1598) TaxID=765440 RepID=A0A0C3AZX9_PILCF|nr:hypothetical protein PILCRDRAFT_10362 [Piloderma croceum F 1598]
MASVADGFKDDLEEIRKEPNLGTSRLSLLINSLASGADVFTSVSRPGDPQAINEMEVKKHRTPMIGNCTNWSGAFLRARLGTLVLLSSRNMLPSAIYYSTPLYTVTQRKFTRDPAIDEEIDQKT